MIDAKHLQPTKLLWVDLEMTGLEPADHKIIEIAAKVTDFDFNVLGEYHALIHQPDAVLEHATEWNKTNHGGSGGLFERVRKEGRPEKEVVQEFARLIHEYFGEEPAVLAGNSIHQDRRFIRQWWPEIERLLHYRMLDVSSWKIILWGKYNEHFMTQENHRAQDDIDESIAELQYYLDWLATHAASLAS